MTGIHLRRTGEVRGQPAAAGADSARVPIFVICAGTQVVLGGIGGRPLTVNEARLRGGRGDAPADPLLDNRGGPVQY